MKRTELRNLAGALLVLALAVCMAACSSADDERQKYADPELIGTWQREYNAGRGQTAT